MLADPAALSPGDRAKALAGLGHALVFLERLEQARAPLIEALGLYRDAGDEHGETLVLLSLSAAESIAGAPESSLAWARQALVIYERLEDALGTARTLHRIAEALRDLGDFERSADLFVRSIETRRANGLGSAASTVHSLGDLYLDAGDMPTAERYYGEALALGLPEGDVRLGAYCQVSPASPRETRTQPRPAGCGRSPSGSSTRSASGWSRPSESATSET